MRDECSRTSWWQFPSCAIKIPESLALVLPAPAKGWSGLQKHWILRKDLDLAV